MAFPVEWLRELVDDPGWPSFQRDPDTLSLVTRMLFSSTLLAYPFLPEWKRLGHEDVDVLRAEFVREIAARYPGKFVVLSEVESSAFRWRTRGRINSYRGSGGGYGRLGR